MAGAVQFPDESRSKVARHPVDGTSGSGGAAGHNSAAGDASHERVPFEKPASSMDSQAATVDSDNLDALAVKRVLKRATDLEQQSLQLGSTGLSPAALESAAEELGLDPGYVRAAIAEERLGLLSPRHRRLDKFVGTSQILVSRTFEMDPTEATEALDAWLTRSLMFHKVATGPEGCSYIRRKDMIASMRRTTGGLIGAPDLSRVTAIEVRSIGDGLGNTILVIEADLSIEQVLTVAAGTSIAGVGSAVSIVGATLVDPAVVPLIGVPFSFGLSAFVMYLRARKVESVRLELDRIFELVSSGTPPRMRRTVGEAARRFMGGRAKG